MSWNDAPTPSGPPEAASRRSPLAFRSSPLAAGGIPLARRLSPPGPARSTLRFPLSWRWWESGDAILGSCDVDECSCDGVARPPTGSPGAQLGRAAATG